jgi:hypothetical protein
VTVRRQSLLRDTATVKRFQAVSRNGVLTEQTTEKERITKTKEEQLIDNYLPPIDSARKVEARVPDMLGK